MKKTIHVLLKQKFTLLLNNEKWSSLNLSNISYASKKKGPGGRLLAFFLDQEKTKFEITDYIKLSKKLRSNTFDVFEKETFQYNLVGICLAAKLDYFETNTNYIIRNVFDHCAYETRYPLFAPIIQAMVFIEDRQKLLKNNHKTFWFLRKKPLPQSEVPFDYVAYMDSSIFEK